MRIPLGTHLGAHRARQWEAAFLKGVQELGSQASEVTAVTFSGNGPSIVPVDSGGEPCGPAVLWNDPGIVKDPELQSLFLPVVRRLREYDSAAVRSARWFSGCPEYLAGRITGSWRTFLPSAEFASYIWSEGEILSCGFSPERFPPMAVLGSRIGAVQSWVSRISPLPKGIPVYAGGPDYIMALLGTAVTVPGRVCDRTGTSEALNICIAHEDLPQSNTSGLRVLPHAVEGCRTAAVLLPDSGALFQQILASAGALRQPEEFTRRLFSHQILDESFDEAVLSAVKLLQSGESFDASRILQLTGSEPGQNWVLAGRVLSEALGCLLCAGLERIKQLGYPVHAVRVSGGQMNSGWNRLKADFLRLPLEIPAIRDAELAGCAAACFTGSGLFSDIAEASESLYSLGETIQPDAARSMVLAQRMARLFPRQFPQKLP